MVGRDGMEISGEKELLQMLLTLKIHGTCRSVNDVVEVVKVGTVVCSAWYN